LHGGERANNPNSPTQATGVIRRDPFCTGWRGHRQRQVEDSDSLSVACPSGAVKVRHFTDEQIYAQIEGVL
jgi:hypothetical protein